MPEGEKRAAMMSNTEEQMVVVPAWVLTRLLSALYHASGYCEGLGKPCAYVDDALEVLGDKVMQAFGERGGE